MAEELLTLTDTKVTKQTAFYHRSTSLLIPYLSAWQREWEPRISTFATFPSSKLKAFSGENQNVLSSWVESNF